MINLISRVLILSLVIFCVLSGVPCNWYLEVGIAEGYCDSVNSPNGGASSNMFNCNGNNGTVNFYSSIDCSGEPIFTSELDPLTDNFVCGSNDNSCGVTKSVENGVYLDSLDCSGDLSSEFFFIFYFINKIDCFEAVSQLTQQVAGLSFIQSATPDDGFGVTYFNDTECKGAETPVTFNIPNNDCRIRPFEGANNPYSTIRTFTFEIEPHPDSSDSSDSSSSESSESSESSDSSSD